MINLSLTSTADVINEDKNLRTYQLSYTCTNTDYPSIFCVQLPLPDPYGRQYHGTFHCIATPEYMVYMPVNSPFYWDVSRYYRVSKVNFESTLLSKITYIQQEMEGQVNILADMLSQLESLEFSRENIYQSNAFYAKLSIYTQCVKHYPTYVCNCRLYINAVNNQNEPLPLFLHSKDGDFIGIKSPVETIENINSNYELKSELDIILTNKILLDKVIKMVTNQVDYLKQITNWDAENLT